MLLLVMVFACGGRGETDPDTDADADADVDADTDTDTDTGSALPLLIITDLGVEDEGADGQWSRGERAVIRARLVNPTTEDHLVYPAAVLTGSTGVDVESGTAQYYALFARSSYELEFSASLAADASGTVTVTVTATDLEGFMGDSRSLDITVR